MSTDCGFLDHSLNWTLAAGTETGWVEVSPVDPRVSFTWILKEGQDMFGTPLESDRAILDWGAESTDDDDAGAFDPVFPGSHRIDTARLPGVTLAYIRTEGPEDNNFWRMTGFGDSIDLAPRFSTDRDTLKDWEEKIHSERHDPFGFLRLFSDRPEDLSFVTGRGRFVLDHIDIVHSVEIGEWGNSAFRMAEVDGDDAHQEIRLASIRYCCRYIGDSVSPDAKTAYFSAIA